MASRLPLSNTHRAESPSPAQVETTRAGA